MNDGFKKLLNLLELNDQKTEILGDLNELLVNKTDNSWFFDISFLEPLDVDVFDLFLRRLNNLPSKFAFLTDVTYSISYQNNNFSKVEEYYDYVLRTLSKQKPRFNSIIDFEIEIDKDKIKLVCPKDGTYVTNLLYEVKKELSVCGFNCILSTRICDTKETITERIEQKNKVYQNTVSQEAVKPKLEKVFLTFRDKYIRKITNKISDIPVSNDELSEYLNLNDKANFVFEGEVISTESRKINQATNLFTFIVSDLEDSIHVKKFVRDKDEAAFLAGVKAGMLMKVSGFAQFDKFLDEVSVNAQVIERTESVHNEDSRTDTEDEKRVELHLHSKMSTMDAITSVSDYVKRASKWGHRAIALTDHGNVQAFPELFKATKGTDVTPIYGVELTLVDEESLEIITNPFDGLIQDQTYVVFDIETTGLSVNYDKMIEISAVKIKNNHIIDEFETLINPERPISPLITKITSITSSDVALSPKIDEVIPKIKEFFKDSILVAHNAHFDMGHIIQNLKDHDLYDQEYTVIDTLSVARNLYADKMARFNLKALAKFLKVSLVQHHRAIYDTRATADIFLHMLREFNNYGIKNLKDLNELTKNTNAYKHSISKHVNLIVKNQKGLRNLFKIVSLANTKYFHKEARIMKKVLDKNREGILIGSGCMNSHFFETAINKNYDELLEVAKFYDYLEIQPLSDYMYLGENFDNVEEVIKDTINKILKAGKELDIPVCVTGDVHHLEEKDSVYREIYVQTPVVGGGRHPLVRYETIPSQFFRTTKEMLSEFEYLDEDIRKEIVITNPNKIVDSLEPVTAFSNELYAPTDDFLALDGILSVENKLIKMVSEKAKSIYGENLPKILEDRINKEINSITQNKFSTVYYISHLLVKKSLDDGYLVGSRGSVGSSLVATLMDITEVNPMPPHYVCPKCQFSSFKMTTEAKTRYGIKDDEIKFQTILDKADSGFDLPDEKCPHCDEDLKKDGHDIPFETFLGFKGDKVPDIDLNFSGDYQGKVHEYIREIFGHDRAFRAGTISTVADKTAFGYVKGYLERTNKTLRKAEIERRAKKIAGVKKSTGQHPGGIVVVPNYKEIIDVTPYQFPADDTSSNWMTTHFDYHSFEENLFKLDVLGHDDPTMIKYLMDFVEKDPLDFPFADARDIPLDDKEVYKLLNSTEIIGLTKEDLNSDVASFGIPEMGTGFVRGMLRDSRPSNFAELVKISGLSHGTDVWLNNAESLVTGKTKFGKIPFKDVIGCRDDIMVFLIQSGLTNEQAFEISEFIRKGKAAKNKEAWEGYKLIMKEKNIPDWYIWSAGQIKYMFPKAHATAYVMMAMRIAWFKLHRPIHFYSAYFSKRASDFDVYALSGGEYAITKRMNEIEEKGNKASETEKRQYTVLEIALEMVKRGFSFKPITLEKSAARNFIISEDKKSLYIPFITVEQLGLKVANSIVEARKEKDFTSKDDVKDRTSLSTTLFTKLEMLNVFDSLPDNSQMSIFELS
ncbi:hypothetical protein CI105_07980 [Candidatus Izimaplasma bacterium ZiA1]|uniref:PolC-type DNA polymerase III n=1 Tax=Candidatus Izimoplasma sp. ZiA1 TaxID=2024899 RepID=UPI000BAA6E16|nr:hypothetical protein CI105_07980 [Candidatus Izimaplasma bacterium ZiA1]